MSKQSNNKDRGNNSAKNNAQESQKPLLSISSDQQEAHEVKQAMKNDQSLSDVAGDIHVTVKDGAITLDGKVSTKQQVNLATNTATAVGMVDQVNNRIEVIHH